MLGSYVESYILSQIFGLYFTIIAIIYLNKGQYYQKLFHQTQKPTVGMMSSALIFLLISIALVVFHNVWEPKPRVWITIICWFYLLKSILWLSIPEFMLSTFKAIWTGNRYKFIFGLLLLFGLAMTVRGFSLYLTQQAHIVPFGLSKLLGH